MMYHSKAPLYVTLREPVPLFKNVDLRCFVKGGKIIAVSRYFYREDSQFLLESGIVANVAKEFYENHLKDHYSEVIFDLSLEDTEKAILIELNPYGLSDSCSFGTVEKRGIRLLPIKEYLGDNHVETYP